MINGTRTGRRLARTAAVFGCLLLLQVSGWQQPDGRRASLVRSALAQPAPTILSPSDGERSGGDAAFAEAFKLYHDGLYGSAASTFDLFLRNYPDHPLRAEGLYYRAESTLGTGQSDDAIALYRRFHETYPNHPLTAGARLALGQYFYETGRHEEAIETFRALLEGGPQPDLGARALYWMGESALSLGRDEQAVRFFQESATSYPQTDAAPVAWYAVAFTQLKRGRYPEAAAAFEQLSARHPRSPYATNVGIALAEVYYELGQYENAVSEAEGRLQRLRGADADRAAFLLAESYNQLRNSTEAIFYYRRIVESETPGPFVRRARYGLGWNYHFESAYEWAADEFARVRDGRDDDLARDATYYEGVNRKLDGHSDVALTVFEEAARRWPGSDISELALFELGIARYEQRNWAGSIEAFDRLFAAFPDSKLLGEALGYSGGARIALGDFDGALATYDRAIALSAADPAMHDELVFQKAWLLYRNERFDLAATALQALAETGAGQRTDDALFWAAESRYQLGDLPAAGRGFRTYLERYPEGEQVTAAHYALGWTSFKQSDYATAAGYFRTFLDRYRTVDGFVPYRKDAQLRLADSYFALKQYEPAIRAYRILADDGDDYALYQIGNAQTNAGQDGAARRTYQDLVQRFPQSDWRADAAYAIAYQHFTNQRFDEAIAAYNELITRSPADPLAARAQYGIGDAHFNAGNLEEAIIAYQRVLANYPRSALAPDAAASIQYAYLAMDDEDRAIAVIDSFARANPDSPMIDNLRFKQAEVKFQSGQIEEALLSFQQLVRTMEDETLLPEAYFYLGTIFFDRAQYEEARSYLEALVQTFPDSPRRVEAAGRIAEIDMRQERFDAALASYERMESLAGVDARARSQARYGQAVALVRMGRLDEARALVANVNAGGGPATAVEILALARVYESSGDTDQAIGEYRRVVRLSQDEIGAEALARLGALLISAGRHEDAIGELGRMPILFASYDRWMAEGYLLQARAFLALGQRGEASRMFDQVVSMYPESQQATEARAERAALQP